MSARPKILHVYRTMYPDTQGGLEEVIRQICLGTHRLGCENRVFAMTKVCDPWPVELGYARVYRVQQHAEIASCNLALRGWTTFRALTEWADVIHYHFPWPFADVLHLANRIRTPSILTYHADIVRQKHWLKLYQPLMWRFLSAQRQIVATSPNYAATSPVLARFRQKVSVIPIGLDPASYPEPDTEQVREIHAHYGEDFFLFVGVLRYYKGLHVLLEALGQLQAAGKRPTVVIAGQGPEYHALVQRARTLGLSNVHFEGFVSDQRKFALFAACRGVVFPSCFRSEAFGVTLLEASRFARPMISTELGTGTSWVNLDGVTGRVVSPDHPTQLARALCELWENRPLAITMGRAARARFDALFTGERMSQAYLGRYHQLMTEC